MLTIAQITDIHVGAGVDQDDRARNVGRLETTLASIHRLQPRPAAIFATGDLVDRALTEEYAQLKDVLATSQIPVYLGVGNHDAREPLTQVFNPPSFQRDENGFIQYGLDFGPLRVLVIDTLEDGLHGGGFCERRAAWLSRELDAAAGRPTLIFAHHPPIVSGIQWMDPQPQDAWIRRLQRVLTGREHVQAIASGHLHRGLARVFAGQMLVVAPATSLQLTLDLSDIDLQIPDQRALLTDEPPGFMLHAFDGTTITSHACVAGDFPVAVTYRNPLRALSA
jgi:3',5'-cyclic AMP phosphodiesterase CpdA